MAILCSQMVQSGMLQHSHPCMLPVNSALCQCQSCAIACLLIYQYLVQALNQIIAVQRAIAHTRPGVDQSMATFTSCANHKSLFVN